MCVCCSESVRIVAKKQEAIEFEGLIEQPHCITQHPGFHDVCLNRWVFYSIKNIITISEEKNNNLLHCRSCLHLEIDQEFRPA